MDTRINLLPMTEAYAPGAARLDQITFPGEAWSEEAFLREARTPSSFYVVAVLGEEVVGFAGMQQVLDEGYITNIAVAEACRRKGLGRAMLGALIDHCRESGASFLTLEVRQSNAPAIALYESMGFLPEGRRKNFYRQPTEDAILMTKRDLSL